LLFFRYTRAGGIFGKWLHICCVIDVFANTGTTYINGESLGAIVHDTFKPLKPNGLLVIDRDQDAYGGGFQDGDVIFGRYIWLYFLWGAYLSIVGILGSGTICKCLKLTAILGQKVLCMLK
jgi:hypothetical protein